MNNVLDIDVNATRINIDAFVSKKKPAVRPNGSSITSGRINPITSKDEINLVSGASGYIRAEYNQSSGGGYYKIEWRFSGS